MKLKCIKEDNGYTICCQIGKKFSQSWFSNLSSNIDHADIMYIQGRFPIIHTEKQVIEFKKKYKLLFIEVSEEQLDDMKHTLGLNYNKKPYRNYFNTYKDDKNWNDLVNKGLATKGKEVEYLTKDSIYFWLTKEGVEFVLGKSISNKKYKDL
jgi:hypothetical protein